MVVDVRVLGPLEVWRDGTEVAVGASKQRALLALLVVRGGEVGRDVLIDALWGERPPARARNTLQVYVSSLRKALGREVIETTPGGYRLRLGPGSVDAEQFALLFDSGRERLAAGDAAAAAEALGEALALWRGPALVDFRYEAFAQAEAGRLDELRLACVEERIEADMLLGHHARLVGELEALVVEQPLRERLRAQLILALYRSGRQSEALEQYQAARRMLADELGLEPSPELRELERMILAHDPRLAAPEGKPRSNLPVQPTPFIGRGRELAELVELIRSGSRRLVTLTGAGGSGKTRVAIEAAAELVGDYPDGVFWVPLQSLREAQLVLPAIAGALNATGYVGKHIAERRMLIVLDNFEHLLDAAPDTAALLSTCPNLSLLATSREPLHLAAEREQGVPPMTEQDATALFQERAIEQGPEQVVSEICRRLDCLPLAVELAAARTKTFPPEEVLERLDERLPLLTGGPRDAPARQQTLHSAIEWSFGLLSPEHQTLFARLSVFVGGWTVEAAGDVCQATLDQLEALRDKSLLVYGDGRYSMLETIREFAAERLTDSGEGSAIRDAHALCYARLGERAHNEIGRSLMEASPDVLRRWLPQLEHELGNIRAALRWFVDHDQSEQALRLVLAVRALWTRGGRLDLEADRWFGEAFASPGVVMPLTRAHALHQWGTLHVLEGRPAEGEPLLLESLAIYRELENTSDASRILRDIAMAAHVAGDLDRARQLYEEIETLQLEDRGFRTLVHGELGQVELWAGNLERARGLLQSAVREAAELDNARMLVMFTADLAEVDRLEGAYERAARLYAEALRLAQSVLFERWVYNCLVGLAAVAADEGRLERAGRLWGAVLQIVASEGDHLLAVNRKRYKLPLENRGETEFLGAVKDGRSLGLNDAVAYALGESA